MQGYEGHCVLEPDRDTRLREAHAANAKLIEVVDHLAEHGFPSEVVSAGGTGTYFITGANPHITEVQAGSYTLMDCFHDTLVPGGFEVALTVLGTVVSLKGNTVVLDAGRKSVGIDSVLPPMVGYPEGQIRYYAEEHALFDFPGDAAPQPRRPSGDHGRIRTNDRQPLRRLPCRRGRRRDRHLGRDATQARPSGRGCRDRRARRRGTMRVIVGTDANGSNARALLREVLEERGVDVRDISEEAADVDYPDVADRVARAVASGEADRGILICGTGIGMSIVANKVPGVRAALAHDTYSAERAIKSNNAQVLTMGALVIGPQLMRTIVGTWIDAVWDEQSPSAKKVNRIVELEEDRWRGTPAGA